MSKSFEGPVTNSAPSMPICHVLVHILLLAVPKPKLLPDSA